MRVEGGGGGGGRDGLSKFSVFFEYSKNQG